MIKNFAPTLYQGGKALPPVLSYWETLDVRTSRKVGMFTAEVSAVYELSACASGNAQPRWHCSAAYIGSHQTNQLEWLND